MYTFVGLFGLYELLVCSRLAVSLLFLQLLVLFSYAGDCDISFTIGGIKGGIKDFQVYYFIVTNFHFVLIHQCYMHFVILSFLVSSHESLL